MLKMLRQICLAKLGLLLIDRRCIAVRPTEFGVYWNSQKHMRVNQFPYPMNSAPHNASLYYYHGSCRVWAEWTGWRKLPYRRGNCHRARLLVWRTRKWATAYFSLYIEKGIPWFWDNSFVNGESPRLGIPFCYFYWYIVTCTLFFPDYLFYYSVWL